MCKMIIFAGAIIFKKPPDILKNFHFSTCFKTYYRSFGKLSRLFGPVFGGISDKKSQKFLKIHRFLQKLS